MAKRKKVAVAMSGGVDSSVAAALLKRQGYDVVGVFMQFWFPQGEKYGENRCCSLESWQEAREVADILKIKIHKVNFGRRFKKHIVDEFLKERKSGRTPNPCVLCNQLIKFNLLLEYAKNIFQADCLATGHYVKIKAGGLYRAKDRKKDQSYFLSSLDKKQLKHLLFPLGNYTKKQVRDLAKKWKLPVYGKLDSQEICFTGKSHNDFLKKYLKMEKGKIRDESLKVLGSHGGLPLFTLGQRSGIGLAGGPWYVCGFRQNDLIVTRNQKKSPIFQDFFKVKKINWLSELHFPLSCQVQIRYRAKPTEAAVLKKSNAYLIKLEKKQRAIMPGQTAAFYQKEKLLGGGMIQ